MKRSKMANGRRRMAAGSESGGMAAAGGKHENQPAVAGLCGWAAVPLDELSCVGGGDLEDDIIGGRRLAAA